MLFILYVILYRRCPASELNFCVWTSPDVQQRLSISTSCAGREPGSDSSLARGWRAPSCLLRLHHDEFCSRFCRSGCRDNNVAVRLVCCKRAWSISWQLEKRHSFNLIKTELKRSNTSTTSPRINPFLFPQKKRNSLIRLTWGNAALLWPPLPPVLAQLITETSSS